MDEMVRVFKQENRGIQVRVTYGSSGNFFAQLSQQAPFDIFLSADTVFPRRLVDQGDGLKESEFLYAVGRIVVWARAGSPVQVETLGVRSLLDPSVKKIAIANPRHAPYGRAAVEALKSLGVYGQAREKLVLGENVAQAAQFVQSGVADIGILAMSLVMAPRIHQQGRLWQVPPAAYANIDQAGVILRWTLEREAAERFRDFMFEPKGRAILRRYGFFLPGE
jgi:molybdate transport system substrate-binding protein